MDAHAVESVNNAQMFYFDPHAIIYCIDEGHCCLLFQRCNGKIVNLT